jgi:nonsense-mediated mRNA decay protein 3
MSSDFVFVVADLSGTQFWRYPFVNLCSPKRFVEFMVMQVDITPEKDRPHRVPVSHKVHLAPPVQVCHSK